MDNSVVPRVIIDHNRTTDSLNRLYIYSKVVLIFDIHHNTPRVALFSHHSSRNLIKNQGTCMTPVRKVFNQQGQADIKRVNTHVEA